MNECNQDGDTPCNPGCYNDADSLISNPLIEQVNCELGCATHWYTGYSGFSENIVRGCYEEEHLESWEHEEKNGCVTVDVSLILNFKDGKYTNFEIH